MSAHTLHVAHVAHLAAVVRYNHSVHSNTRHYAGTRIAIRTRH